MKHAGLRTVMRTLSPAKQFNQVHLKRSPVYPVAVLLLCTQLIVGCSTTQNQREAAQQQQSMSASLDHLDNSIQQLTQTSQLSALELSTRIDNLEQTIQSQQAQINALSKALETISHKNHVTKTHLSSPAKAGSAETKVTSIQAPTLAASAAAEPSLNAEAEKNAYTSAYLSLKSARYEEASKAFTDLLQAFPNGEYADQAWYWLGESQFSQNLNKQAIASFKTVIDKFPESGKHAAAMLKLGQVYQASGKKNQARKYFNQVINQHTDSTVAEQARSALAAMQANASTGEK